jgi:hypothetical protein
MKPDAEPSNLIAEDYARASVGCPDDRLVRRLYRAVETTITEGGESCLGQSHAGIHSLISLTYAVGSIAL